MTTTPVKPPRSPSPLVAHGLAPTLNTLTGLRFNPYYPHTYCRLCGAVFQSHHDRYNAAGPNPSPLPRRFKTPQEYASYATSLRHTWSHKHAALHSPNEHLALHLWGLWVRPEAAEKLAAFGIIPITDMVLSEEVAEALYASSPIPANDAEGS